MQALATLADTVASVRPAATLTDLVAELDERAAAQHAPTVQGVTLASLHAAKGLEWDAVFLVGLSEGLMPISMAQGWEAIAEERRLLYVGVTRARERLALSWARARTPGGRASRSSSRFLDDAQLAAVLESAAERKVGRCSTCPPTYDETVFERLTVWRAETASRAKVPPYVVFTDATLVAIAEALPGRLEELAKIPGVGVTKLDRYGAEVLAVLAAVPGDST